MWTYVLHLIPMALMPAVGSSLQDSLPFTDWHILLSLPTHGAKNSIFAMPFLYKNDDFAKTGSGQT
eukprot:COSAG06_NODE_2364_length_7003_cov_3.258980_3_plen_66_part_00